MSHNLEQLLLRWEESRRDGGQVSVEELCHDCPELRDDLLAEITALEKMDRVLDLSDDHDSAAKTEPPLSRLNDLQPNWEPIPGYRLEKRLGRGGFGEVWRAIGPGGFAVALKFVSLNGQLGAKELRSLEIIKTLHHPNLLTTLGAWQVHGFLVIGMELADRTLLDRLQEATGQGLPGIPHDELIRYMHEAAKGIDYLNEPDHRLDDGTKAGIQHRDIKPQNILLMGGGIKIGDFGLLRILKHTVTEHTGSLTLAYAAPEFFMGHATRTSDQYSLAVTYCQLRGGRLPFTGPPGQLMQGHLEGTPDLTMLPEEERGPVERALQKDPERRWLTCGEFANALAACHGSSSSSTSTPSLAKSSCDLHLSKPLARSFGSRRVRVAVSLAVILVIAAGLWSWASRLSKLDARAFLERGRAHDAKKDYDKAIVEFTEAIRLDPTLAEAYHERGHAYRHKQSLNEAIKDFTKALELNPTWANPYYGRGRAYHTNSDYQQAIRDYTEVIRLDPKFILAYKGRAATYRKLNKSALAEADLRTIKRLEGEKPEDNSIDVSTLTQLELKKLQGTWTLQSHTGAGKAKYPRMQIEKDKLTFFHTETKKGSTWTIVLDPSKNPKTMDRIGTSLSRLIYKLDGDKLTLAAGGHDRPDRFESLEGSNVGVEIWRRK